MSLRTLISTALLILTAAVRTASGEELPQMEALDTMLTRYVMALEPQSMETKKEECDFLISSVDDSLLRQRVALSLYGYYRDSKLMGEEAVAIWIYDNWFASRRVAMESEIDLLNAGIFADFNRSSLIGMEAPQLELTDAGGTCVSVPTAGRRSVLYFYDTDCAKCSMTHILLKYTLEEGGWDVDLHAVYTGSDRRKWEEASEEFLAWNLPSVRVFNLWDPELSSDFQKKYGILSTPGLFLVDPWGVIIGRRLTPDALRQLLSIDDIDVALGNIGPVGSLVPDLKIGRKSLRKYRYLVFYSHGCTRCAKELEAIQKVRPRLRKVLKVDIDQVLSDTPEVAQTLFSSFDLTRLPMIVRLDRKGRIVEKYISFVTR